MTKTNTARALAALGLGSLLAGCGGGGGNGGGTGAATTAAPAANSFTPNYVASVTPYHWAHLPVRVYFANDMTITPKGGTPTRLDTLFQTAFDRWPAATGGVISYQIVTDPAQADITVSAVSVPDPTGRAETGLTAAAYSGPVLTSVTTQIFVWPDITPAQLAQGQLATATHEFGHALGIGGHSPDPNDEMYALHAPDQDVQISAPDVNTIKTIYSGLF